MTALNVGRQTISERLCEDIYCFQYKIIPSLEIESPQWYSKSKINVIIQRNYSSQVINKFKGVVVTKLGPTLWINFNTLKICHFQCDTHRTNKEIIALSKGPFF